MILLKGDIVDIDTVLDLDTLKPVSLKKAEILDNIVYLAHYSNCYYLDLRFMWLKVFYLPIKIKGKKLVCERLK